MISVSSRLDLRTQSASSLGALRKFHLWTVLEQFQGRIEATTCELGLAPSFETNG